MTVGVLCENKECAHYGWVVNVVSELDPAELDLFYEGFDGANPEDFCPVCGVLGVPQDAEPETS